MKARNRIIWASSLSFAIAAAILIFLSHFSRGDSGEPDQKQLDQFTAKARELIPKVVQDCKRANSSPGIITDGVPSVTLPESADSLVQLGVQAAPVFQDMIHDSQDPDEEMAGDVARACWNLVIAGHVERSPCLTNNGVVLYFYQFTGTREPGPESKPTLHQRAWRLLKRLVPKT